MRTQLLYCSVLVWLTMACTPGDIASDGGEETSGTATGDESGETGGDGDGDGDGDQPASPAFAEIRCVEVTNSVDVCFGRPEGSADAWLPVTSTCDLDSMIDRGLAVEASAWGNDSCAFGEHPAAILPEWRCLALTDESWCFAGDGDWWVHVTPSCEAPVTTKTAWPGAWCDGSAGSVGAHPWDSVMCTTDAAAPCVATSDDESVAAWATCWIDEHPTAPVPSCSDAPPYVGEMWGPCPIDHASGQPTLCYGENLACVPADFAEANICLPLGECPSPTPEYGTSYEIGWGNACYPRCTTDNDCATGMVCGSSYADGSPMCAWPLE